jgi:hypothetical protein
MSVHHHRHFHHRRHFHRCQDFERQPAPPTLSAVFTNDYTPAMEYIMSTTTVTVTLPTTRADGSALALSAIASVVLTKAAGSGAAVVVDTVNAPATASIVFTDTAPDFGQTDTYSATVTDIEGNVSAPGSTSINVPASTLAKPSAPTLAAVFNP